MVDFAKYLKNRQEKEQTPMSDSAEFNKMLEENRQFLSGSTEQPVPQISSFGDGRLGAPLHARDHLGTRYICTAFEFSTKDFGGGDKVSYWLTVTNHETGEMVKFVGSHAAILERLKYGGPGRKPIPCPFAFKFVEYRTKKGTLAYDMGAW